MQVRQGDKVSVCFCSDEVGRKSNRWVVVLQLPVGNQQCGHPLHVLILTTQRTHVLRKSVYVAG